MNLTKLEGVIFKVLMLCGVALLVMGIGLFLYVAIIDPFHETTHKQLILKLTSAGILMIMFAIFEEA